jgi:hypothetical protein
MGAQFFGKEGTHEQRLRQRECEHLLHFRNSATSDQRAGCPDPNGFFMIRESQHKSSERRHMSDVRQVLDGTFSFRRAPSAVSFLPLRNQPTFDDELTQTLVFDSGDEGQELGQTRFEILRILPEQAGQSRPLVLSSGVSGQRFTDARRNSPGAPSAYFSETPGDEQDGDDDNRDHKLHSSECHCRRERNIVYIASKEQTVGEPDQEDVCDHHRRRLKPDCGALARRRAHFLTSRLILAASSIGLNGFTM